MQPKLTIQIVGWDSEKHLRNAVLALAKIPINECVIRYIDNNSADASISIIRSALPRADIIELPSNMGFANAHNVGFSRCTTQFVLTHDPDVVLNWEGIKQLFTIFEEESVAAVQGKLLRSSNFHSDYSDELVYTEFSRSGDSDRSFIDSAGIVFDLSLSGKDRGAGERDRGQYHKVQDILAVTGACGLFRMKALQYIAYSSSLRNTHTRCVYCGGTSCEGCIEVFDSQFHSYKEDVDVGWRLHKAGWKIKYVPVVVGTHQRTLGKRGNVYWFLHPKHIMSRARDERTRFSIRNYVWMLVKNITLRQEILHEIFILARICYFFTLSILHPPLFSVWHEIVQGMPIMLYKRALFKKRPD